MKTEPLCVREQPLPNGRGSIFRTEQVTCLLAPQRMKTEPLCVREQPLPNGRGSIFRTVGVKVSVSKI
jgi:hypothetical protein